MVNTDLFTRNELLIIARALETAADYELQTAEQRRVLEKVNEVIADRLIGAL
jgi:hypothetical protein